MTQRNDNAFDWSASVEVTEVFGVHAPKSWTLTPLHAPYTLPDGAFNLDHDVIDSGLAESVGSVDWPLTQRIASDIDAHGVEWAANYHKNRGVSAFQWRVLFAGAVTHLKENDEALGL